jgi:hypothetical protein
MNRLERTFMIDKLLVISHLSDFRVSGRTKLISFKLTLRGKSKRLTLYKLTFAINVYRIRISFDYLSFKLGTNLILSQ